MKRGFFHFNMRETSFFICLLTYKQQKFILTVLEAVSLRSGCLHVQGRAQITEFSLYSDIAEGTGRNYTCNLRGRYPLDM